MKQTSDISFAADWLALREPADHSARDVNLLRLAAKSVTHQMTVLDLGSGTGSTLRAFENAGLDQFSWCLLDHDADLLKLATDRHAQSRGTPCNLSNVADLPLDGIGLVTASALLDLMSQTWVESLAKRLRDASLPFYAALNFNGEMSWKPKQQGDTLIVDHFNKHQQRDKGTGPALGPASGNKAASIFEAHGFDVKIAQSPWRIGPEQAVLHTQLLNGIVDAVAEMDASFALSWGEDRKSSVATSNVTVGHLDLLAIPRS